jgi:erythromycin esterase
MNPKDIIKIFKPTLLLILSFSFLQSNVDAQNEIADIPYTENSFEDLGFLKNELQNKSIICLGEEWHGTETFSEVKNRIIKYLHQNLEYKHIIFESSIYSPLVVEQNNLRGKARLLESFQTIWRTQSVLDLVEYFDASENSENRIFQYGIDLQGSYTPEFSKVLVDYFKEENLDLISELNQTEKLIHTEWINNHRTFKKYKSKITLKHLNLYEKLIEIEEAKEESLTQENQRIIWLLQNRIFLCNHLIDNKGKYYREQILAKNLEWTINSIGENEKIIIWAADLHITKKQSQTYKGAEKSMIELLPQNIQNKIYSLSIIPIKSIPKKLRKNLNKQEGRFFFYPTNIPSELSVKKEEFDGIIICKKTEKIEEYKIK